jgi:hypothetical protein
MARHDQRYTQTPEDYNSRGNSRRLFCNPRANHGVVELPCAEHCCLEKAPIPIIIIGFLYYILPFRSRINSVHYNHIIELLRSKLVEIAGVPDNANLYNWSVIKSIFYNLVDNDKSLTIIAGSAYDNGYIWTTFADLTVLSLCFAFLCVMMFYLDVNSAIIAFLTFIIWSLICHVGSIVTTRKQIAIGDEQLVVIKTMYADKVREFFDGLTK